MVTAVNGSIFPPSHVSFKHSEIVWNGIIFHRQVGRKLTSRQLFQLHTAAFCIDRFRTADKNKQLIKTRSVNGRLTVFNCFLLQQWEKEPLLLKRQEALFGIIHSLFYCYRLLLRFSVLLFLFLILPFKNIYTAKTQAGM